ncbi:hypothetical protein Afe04nite_37680 [Asanoa ferruginea]|nr:hypothetical protein Afe04nite_37680 [Asanoa ferruginea]
MISGAARGLVAAMAMSGLRRVTTTLELVADTPPEAIVEATLPGIFDRIPEERRPVIVEAVHWTYGTLGGAAFGLLPRKVRRRPLAGLIYGALFWTAFEVGIAPLLGLPQAHRWKPEEEAALLADHLLYGVVVAASAWPHRD